MENRCDSVDALMYAYYAFMKRKEENQMLEKNKDYLEMRVSSTDCAFAQNEWAQVRVDGYVYTTYMNIPDPGKLYIFISKEKFEKMQADNQHYRELAKQREENYNLLLKKTGFDTVESLVLYLNDIHQLDTLLEVLANYGNKIEALQTENEQLKKKLHEFDPIPDYKELLEKLYSKDDVEKLEWTLNHICGGQASVNGWKATAKFWRQNCETISKLVGFSSVEEIQDYLTNEAECDTLHGAISKLKDQVKYTCDEWYSANSSNNSWKAAAECNSPKELIEKLNLLRDDISGRSTVIEHHKRTIEEWQKATGCISPKDISTSSLISKVKVLEQELKILNGALQEWKEVTGCPSPSAVKAKEAATWSTSYENVKNLNEEIVSWRNVTGFSTPEDYEGGWAKIRCLCESIYKSNGNEEREQDWQDATGCNSPLEANIRIRSYKETIKEWETATGYKVPEAAKERAENLASWHYAYNQAKEKNRKLEEEINELRDDYSHLLCTTGFESEGEIEDALDKCDHSTLRKALVDYEFDYDSWQEATGCKYPAEARILLEKWKVMTKCETPEAAATWITSYEKACERGNELAEGAAEREKEWQKATGRIDPEAAKQYIDRLKGRLNKIHGYSIDW